MYPLINRDNTCCFSGHRPTKLPWRFHEEDPRCVRLKENIFKAVSALYASGIHHYICGMALGCDMYFCEAVIRLREEHPDITLEAAIPCEVQALKWTEAQRNRYYNLIEQCNFETLLQRPYTKDCMRKRNCYMVDSSSVLLAVYDGTLSGTMQTIHYAEKRGLEIHILPVEKGP